MDPENPTPVDSEDSENNSHMQVNFPWDAADVQAGDFWEEPAGEFPPSSSTPHLLNIFMYSSLEMIRSTVTDGIVMGHPCCAVPKRHERLATNRSLYCPDHLHLKRKCAVEDCHRPIQATAACSVDFMHKMRVS